MGFFYWYVMQALLHSYIGDLFAFDFYLKDDVRTEVTEVVFDLNMSTRVRDLVPIVFPNLKNIIVCNASQSRAARFEYIKAPREAVLKAFPQLDSDILDLRQWLNYFWCNPKAFPNIEPMPVSKGVFLTQTLASVKKFKLPAEFILVHPASAWSHQPNRDFNLSDLFAVNILAKRLQLPVVLIGNSNVPLTINKPKRHSVATAQAKTVCEKLGWLNYTDQTTKFETLEILKKASIFTGASSCWAVLAAARLPEKNVLIRPDDHLIREKKLMPYFYPFSTPAIFGDRPLTLANFDRIQK